MNKSGKGDDILLVFAALVFCNRVCALSAQLSQNDRRSVLQTILTSSISTSFSSFLVPFHSLAATESPISPLREPSDATDKVYIKVRISRSDGSFYDRSGESSVDPTDDVFSAKIKIELFGKSFPVHVEQFLKFVEANKSIGLEDDPFPNYSTSIFSSYDDAQGILYGGTIPGLSVENFAGSSALRYGNRIIPSKLWLENQRSESTLISGLLPAGMLVHRSLDVMPSFGITVRPTTVRNNKLLASSDEAIVFGQVILDEDGKQFLARVSSLPTYSVDRPMYPGENDLRRGVATNVYNGQRDFMRGFANAIGDIRVTKVYNGKLLRRVEVTEVGR
uniref:PPIase cyclophilin-type domain-containing protein n=1 Tax=Corethron hystrix TaxID=216773 RepID=A0A7S1FPN0_9STRA|mmetsp:Transcript_21198/g.48128  ORF Transcript_21198/g.48128 Transcript_21198/m.48128 type:complete len:334 (+) Transcript_21198:108-1109(+)